MTLFHSGNLVDIVVVTEDFSFFSSLMRDFEYAQVENSTNFYDCQSSFAKLWKLSGIEQDF